MSIKIKSNIGKLEYNYFTTHPYILIAFLFIVINVI